MNYRGMRVLLLSAVCVLGAFALPNIGGCSGVSGGGIEVNGPLGPIINGKFHIDQRDLDPTPHDSLPPGSVPWGFLGGDGRNYPVYQAPDGTLWVVINGKCYRLRRLPPIQTGADIILEPGAPQGTPSTPSTPAPGLTPIPVPGSSYQGSYTFDTDANTATLEFVAPVSPEFDPLPLEELFDVTIMLTPQPGGQSAVRIQGSVNGVLAGAMDMGLSRVEDAQSPWGDMRLVLDPDWGIVYVDQNGQPYTEIILVEGQ